MREETTGAPRQSARPPRRGINFNTFCRLEGITPEIVADMEHCLHGDGYDRVNQKTRAFMRRHNLAWVSLYGADWELG